MQAAFIPVHLRNALFAALEAAITSCISPGYHDALERAIDLLKPLQAARLRSRTSRENITYVQALILMSMATQSSGSMHIRETTWFDQALSIAWYMRLHQSHLYNDAHDDVPDPELDHGRRIWLTLVLLDRWSAISTAGPLKIADNYAKLVPSDHALIGSSSYHLVRKRSLKLCPCCHLDR